MVHIPGSEIAGYVVDGKFIMACCARNVVTVDACVELTLNEAKKATFGRMRCALCGRENARS